MPIYSMKKDVPSKEAIEEFQQIYKETYGKEISFDEASEKASKLLKFFNIIYKPIKEFDNFV